MLKLHGTSKSRSARSLWALEELGVKYEHNPLEVAKAKSPEHLKLNPNGHVPVLEDDGVVLWESMAINLYLAEKHGKSPFQPSTPHGRAEAIKWSFWGMTEVEPHLLTVLRNRLMLPPEQRNTKAAEEVDDHLKGREYLLSKDFTIADLNVAAILSFALLAKINFSATPTALAWLQKCLGREANQRVRAMA